MSERVSLVELDKKKSGSNLVYFLFFGLFLVLTFIVVYYFLVYKTKTQTSISATPTPTIAVLPGIFSPDKNYRSLHVINQLQIFSSSDTMIFKLYDKNFEATDSAKIGKYFPEKWSDDSRNLIYKLTYSDYSSFGLIYLNQSGAFVADPKAVASKNCTEYAWSPDSKKIVFYKSALNSLCPGTLIEINSKISVRTLAGSKQSVENAFWDSDSKKLNYSLNIGTSTPQTKIISL